MYKWRESRSNDEYGAIYVGGGTASGKSKVRERGLGMVRRGREYWYLDRIINIPVWCCYRWNDRSIQDRNAMAHSLAIDTMNERNPNTEKARQGIRWLSRSRTASTGTTTSLLAGSRATWPVPPNGCSRGRDDVDWRKTRHVDCCWLLCCMDVTRTRDEEREENYGLERVCVPRMSFGIGLHFPLQIPKSSK